VEGFDFVPRTRVVYGPGALARLGELARELGFRRTLLVSDEGLVQAGYVAAATRSLTEAGVASVPFHDFGHDPDSDMVARGAAFAREKKIDSLVALGGGSSMDCAKGIDFVLTNGGTMADYRGYAKAAKPLLPMIGIPTTAGTGSEAQSYALVSDAKTHEKMACGDPGAAFRVAILDPELALTAPRAVTAATGYDAIAHAVESYASTKASPLSDVFAREAWRRLDANFERVLAQPDDLEARGAMLLGAHFAGLAIECSMLGATHACANPLSARYGTVHGVAIALLLPHVVRWNAAAARSRYAELLALSGRRARQPARALADRLEEMAVVGGLPRGLRGAGVVEADLKQLADEAAQQWTGRFNPRAFDAAGALELYRTAFE
jgi:alcohol dehydrogenase class IV